MFQVAGVAEVVDVTILVAHVQFQLPHSSQVVKNRTTVVLEKSA